MNIPKWIQYFTTSSRKGGKKAALKSNHRPTKSYKLRNINPSKAEAQTALFKDPVRTAL